MKKHSVLLKEELCKGCTICVKNCPTQAIRVHQGKATIKNELCVDCAECIRVCVYHAKYSETASLSNVPSYKYPIVLVPPSFYAQFNNASPHQVRTSLYQLGFVEVLDVSLAAEALSEKTSQFLDAHAGPFISSSCPVVVRLIKTQYPELARHLIPFKSPVEAMAERARLSSNEKEMANNDLGVFFITPCPAKKTNTFDPLGMEQSFIDHTISASQAYQGVREVLDDDHSPQTFVETDLDPLPYLGMGWGQSGGEINLLPISMQERCLSVSGIHRVRTLLDELSRNNIQDVQYFELSGCNYGCVGGVFNVANVFQARFNLRRLRTEGDPLIERDYDNYNFQLSRAFKPLQLGQLDDDLKKALEKFNKLEEEIEALPGLDCAACGAPDCRTLAEDIVNNMAKQSDCIFLLREQVGELADRLSLLVEQLPTALEQRGKKVKSGDDR